MSYFNLIEVHVLYIFHAYLIFELDRYNVDEKCKQFLLSCRFSGTQIYLNYLGSAFIARMIDKSVHAEREPTKNRAGEWGCETATGSKDIVR